MYETGKNMKYYNIYRVQHLKSANCGLFALYVIDELNKNRNYMDILSDFDNSNFSTNEEKIEKIFDKKPKIKLVKSNAWKQI